MGMDVDETRCHEPVGGIDRPAGRRARQPADGGNPPVLNSNIASQPRVSRSIHHTPVADEQVVRRLSLAAREGNQGQTGQKAEGYSKDPAHAPIVSAAGTQCATQDVWFT